jgi:hypothetical protein
MKLERVVCRPLRAERRSWRLERQTDGGLQLVEAGLLVGDFAFEPERTEIVTDEEATIVAIFVVETDCIVTAPTSMSMSSTIIAPNSPPTYIAPSRAKAGVASRVDESAIAMASFRINFPLSSASLSGTTMNSIR